MSLCISVVTPEGIIIAGESRTTQFVGNINRIGSDSANKVFQLTDTIFAASTGWAFLQPQGSTTHRNISSLIEDFKLTIPANSSIQTISGMLWTYFNTIYQQHITQFSAQAVPAGQVALNFIIGGYDPGSRVGTLFSFDIPSVVTPTTPIATTNNPTARWIGQHDVVGRIIKGYDIGMLNLPFVQTANQTGVGNAAAQLNGLEYIINCGTMTIQDAIDFAVEMIKITTTIQKFTAGTILQPGGLAGVGGPIDVAIIKPGGEFTWIHQKELHIK